MDDDSSFDDNSGNGDDTDLYEFGGGGGGDGGNGGDGDVVMVGETEEGEDIGEPVSILMFKRVQRCLIMFDIYKIKIY